MNTPVDAIGTGKGYKIGFKNSPCRQRVQIKWYLPFLVNNKSAVQPIFEVSLMRNLSPPNRASMALILLSASENKINKI